MTNEEKFNEMLNALPKSASRHEHPTGTGRKRLLQQEGGRRGMNERAKTIGLIADMLCKIADEKLLNRIYRFTKYIYIHRDGRDAA